VHNPSLCGGQPEDKKTRGTVPLVTPDALVAPVWRRAEEQRHPLFTRIIKWFSVVALLLGLLLSSSASYRIALEIEVCVAAFVVVAQAVRMGKYMWAMAFLALGVLFNPAVPVPLNHRLYLGLEWFSIGAFLISLAALRARPMLSIPSITGRTPGSISL
jgi:hypothetical protein